MSEYIDKHGKRYGKRVTHTRLLFFANIVTHQMPSMVKNVKHVRNQQILIGAGWFNSFRKSIGNTILRPSVGPRGSETLEVDIATDCINISCYYPVRKIRLPERYESTLYRRHTVEKSTLKAPK